MSIARDSEPAPNTVSAAGTSAHDGDADGVGGDVTGAGEGEASLPRPQSATEAAPAALVGTSGLVFGDPLDRPSSDDIDRGWNDPFSGAGDDDFTRFLNEKPPHHL